MMSKSLHEVCTREAPSKEARHHPDAVVVSREEAGDKWPHYKCPNCGIDTQLPEWNTVSAKKILGQP
jgi:hypothetical protein